MLGEAWAVGLSIMKVVQDRDQLSAKAETKIGKACLQSFWAQSLLWGDFQEGEWKVEAIKYWSKKAQKSLLLGKKEGSLLHMEEDVYLFE